MIIMMLIHNDADCFSLAARMGQQGGGQGGEQQTQQEASKDPLARGFQGG